MPGMMAMPGMTRTPQSSRQRLEFTLKKLRESKDEQEIQAARAELRQTLGDIFRVDMQARQQQAQEIELRLAKLRQQYQEREKVKDEIIDLQLQVLEKEAAGLGFPEALRGFISPDSLKSSSGDLSNPTPPIGTFNPPVPARRSGPDGPVHKPTPAGSSRSGR